MNYSSIPGAPFLRATLTHLTEPFPTERTTTLRAQDGLFLLQLLTWIGTQPAGEYRLELTSSSLTQAELNRLKTCARDARHAMDAKVVEVQLDAPDNIVAMTKLLSNVVTESQQAQVKPNTERDVLDELIRTVRDTGGVEDDSSGEYYPVGDPEWVDLGYVYINACRCLGVEALINGEYVDLKGKKS